MNWRDVEPDVSSDLVSVPPSSQPWSGGQILVLGLACLIVWFAILVFAGGIVAAFEWEEGAAEYQATLVIGQLAGGIIGWLAMPIWYLRRRRMEGLIRWPRPQWRDAGEAGLGLIGIYIALAVYMLIIGVIGADNLQPESTIGDDDLYAHTIVVVLLGLMVVLAAPIYEEAFARGFLLGGLRRAWGIIPAFLISAAVFAALHADLGSMIPFAIAAVVLGLLYHRSGNLTAASRWRISASTSSDTRRVD